MSTQAGREPMTLSEALGAEIRAERNAQKRTQADVFEAVGISKRAYIKYEAGAMPLNTIQLAAICAHLGVSASELVAKAEARLAKAQHTGTGGAISARESAEIDEVVEKMHPRRVLPLDETDESGTIATGM